MASARRLARWLLLAAVVLACAHSASAAGGKKAEPAKAAAAKPAEGAKTVARSHVDDTGVNTYWHVSRPPAPSARVSSHASGR